MRKVMMLAVASLSTMLTAMEGGQETPKPKAVQALIGMAYMASEKKGGDDLKSSTHECRAIGFADENEQLIKVLPYRVLNPPRKFSEISEKHRAFFAKHVDTSNIQDKITVIGGPCFQVTRDEWECTPYNGLRFRKTNPTSHKATKGSTYHLPPV